MSTDVNRFLEEIRPHPSGRRFGDKLRQAGCWLRARESGISDDSPQQNIPPLHCNSRKLKNDASV